MQLRLVGAVALSLLMLPLVCSASVAVSGYYTYGSCTNSNRQAAALSARLSNVPVGSLRTTTL